MKKHTLYLIASMIIFGTIGVVRHFIPYSSVLIAAVRAVIGAAFLLILHGLRKETFDCARIRQNLWKLALSGAMIGVNWILFLEAMNHTAVSVATICYYMAPVFLILVSPVLLYEKLTLQKGLCALVAVLGAVLVSGVLQNGFSGAKGIAFALGAAVLYVGIMVLNKGVAGLSATDRTFFQFVFAALVLVPYFFLTQDVREIAWQLRPTLLLILTGVLHTGIAYWLFFAGLEKASAQAVAIFSYIDPAVAVLLSALVLQEPLSLLSLVGVVLVLAGATASELDLQKK